MRIGRLACRALMIVAALPRGTTLKNVILPET